jgi:MFS transporter, ACS family, tartrate transporter
LTADVSRSSDRMLERRYHVAIPAVVAGTALLLLGTAPSPVLSMALLCLLAVGVYSYLAPFWALPNEFLTGYSAAAGIALVNSVGNLGGFLGPATIAAVPVFVSAILVILLPTVGYFAHHTGRLFAGLTRTKD